MRQASLLAALLLLLLPLAAHRAAAEFPVHVYDEKTVNPWQNDRYVSLSASGGGGGELEGGYGAVIKAEVAPVVGATYWSASGSVTVHVDDVSYTVAVKVLFINPSTGLGEWRYLASAAGTTYTRDYWVFKGYSEIRPVEYFKRHEWTLPSSGDYPARVRVDFSISACAEFKELVGLLDSKADEEGLKDALDVVSSKGVEEEEWQSLHF